MANPTRMPKKISFDIDREEAPRTCGTSEPRSILEKMENLAHAVFSFHELIDKLEAALDPVRFHGPEPKCGDINKATPTSGCSVIDQIDTIQEDLYNTFNRINYLRDTLAIG